MEAGLQHWADWLVVAVYFLIVFAVAFKSIFRKNRESREGYFLAGRAMTWIPVGASLFASNIGSEHFIGLAGTGAASGVAVVAFEWGAVLLLLLLGWVFLPVYLTTGIYTMPEYLGRRFGGTRMRLCLAVLALLLYVVIKVSVDVYAGVFFIQLATGLDLYVAMIPLLAVTAAYTVIGGLATVVYTDTLQTVVMILGSLVLCILAFLEVGGLGGLYARYPGAVATPPTQSPGNVTAMLADPSNVTVVMAGATTMLLNVTATMGNTTTNLMSQCGRPRDDAFHVLRSPATGDLPWPGVLFRATVASLWYWCCDQINVQRALSARSLAHARAGCLLAGWLKLTPLFLIIMPGMVARVLYPDTLACVGAEACRAACGNPAGCSNMAYPTLILRLAPVGLRGLLMSAMVAALVSSLTSVFNSAMTVFTVDIWQRIRPQAQDKEMVFVGRLFVVVLLVTSVLWIPLIQRAQGGQLFLYMMAVTGYIAPPISAVFLLAMLVPRVNETGAFWGFFAGLGAGVSRMVLDFVYPAPACGEPDLRPRLVSDFHFTYFSILVFAVSVAVTLGLSLLTTAQDRKELVNLTFWTMVKRPEASSTEQSETMFYKPSTTSLANSDEDAAQSDQCLTVPSRDGNGRSADKAPYVTSSRLPVGVGGARARLLLNVGAVVLVAALVALTAAFR